MVELPGLRDSSHSSSKCHEPPSPNPSNSPATRSIQEMKGMKVSEFIDKIERGEFDKNPSKSKNRKRVKTDHSEQKPKVGVIKTVMEADTATSTFTQSSQPLPYSTSSLSSISVSLFTTSTSSFHNNIIDIDKNYEESVLLNRAYLDQYGEEYVKHIRSIEEQQQVRQKMPIYDQIQPWSQNLDQIKVNYIAKQPYISLFMRTVLVDWLMEISDEFHLQPMTLHIACNILDSILSHIHLSEHKQTSAAVQTQKSDLVAKPTTAPSIATMGINCLVSAVCISPRPKNKNRKKTAPSKKRRSRLVSSFSKAQKRDCVGKKRKWILNCTNTINVQDHFEESYQTAGREDEMHPDYTSTTITRKDGKLIKVEGFIVAKQMFQCVGCACLLIASKLQEINPPSATHLSIKSDHQYTPLEITSMEKKICRIMKFQFQPCVKCTSYPLLHHLLDISSHSSSGKKKQDCNEISQDNDVCANNAKDNSAKVNVRKSNGGDKKSHLTSPDSINPHQNQNRHDSTFEQSGKHELHFILRDVPASSYTYSQSTTSTLELLCSYLIDLSLLEYKLMVVGNTKKSLVAASALYLARATLGLRSVESSDNISTSPFWTKRLESSSGYTPQDLKAVVFTLHRWQQRGKLFIELLEHEKECYSGLTSSPVKSIFLKYKTVQNHRVSLIPAPHVLKLGFETEDQLVLSTCEL